jgi:hypothetical protein
MKYFLHSSSIRYAVSLAVLRWRGPFRSHSGFALLGILAVVIVIFLILQLAGHDEPQKAGNDGAQK